MGISLTYFYAKLVLTLNKLYILEINPSYGAYYVALIEDIRIIRN